MKIFFILSLFVVISTNAASNTTASNTTASASGVKWCSDENEVCNCTSGNIFIGEKNTTAGTNATFEDMLTKPIDWIKANGSSLNCSIENFVSTLLVSGSAKQCYCDSEKTVQNVFKPGLPNATAITTSTTTSTTSNIKLS